MSSSSVSDETTSLLSARTAGVVEESSDFPHSVTNDRPLGDFRVEIFSLLKHSIPGSPRLHLDSKGSLLSDTDMVFSASDFGVHTSKQYPNAFYTHRRPIGAA